MPTDQILTKTKIMPLISSILTFQRGLDEEFYFMRLEAIWILINLAMCDTEDIKLMFVSEIKDLTAEVEPICKEKLKVDFEKNESSIFITVNLMLKEYILEQPNHQIDFKFVNNIMHFYANLASTG